MSGVDKNEVTSPNLPTTTTTGEEVEMGKFHRHKIIHFTDGSTMEEDVDTDEDVDSGGSTVGASSAGGGDAVEDIVNRTGALQLESDASKKAEVPQVDTSKMSWAEWIKYYSARGGSTVLGGLETAGEKLAYTFGITTPKYQHEIDEYNREVAKRDSEAEEAKAWSGTNPSFVPIVSDPEKSGGSGIGQSIENGQHKNDEYETEEEHHTV